MNPPRLFALDPASGVHRGWTVPDQSLAACLLRSREGLVLVGARGLVRVVMPHDGDALRTVPLRGLPLGQRETFNDGKAHLSGALVLASADVDEAAPLGGLGHVAADGHRTRIEPSMVMGNGPAFSPDGATMYASDTIGRRILAYSLDGGGRPDGPGRVLVGVAPSDGMPDGMTTDAEGALWVAFWGGGQVVRYDPRGRPTRRVALPVRHVTNCAFGGADLRTLWITTASAGLSAADRIDQPGAGGLFAFRTEIPGQPEPEMAPALSAEAC